jgi:hypothetical protein
MAAAVIALLVPLGILILCAVRIAMKARWAASAAHARIPISERRVTLPPQPGSGPWTTKPVGYRETAYTPPPRRGAISLDPSRDRGPDVRVLPGNRSLAVRIRVGRGRFVLVRVDAALEGEDVVVRALAARPDEEHPDWQARLAGTLEPFLDGVLHELTGLRPSAVPKTRVAVGEDERAEEPGSHRRSPRWLPR